jgi:hypothetical protein
MPIGRSPVLKKVPQILHPDEGNLQSYNCILAAGDERFRKRRF